MCVRFTLFLFFFLKMGSAGPLFKKHSLTSFSFSFCSACSSTQAVRRISSCSSHTMYPLVLHNTQAAECLLFLCNQVLISRWWRSCQVVWLLHGVRISSVEVEACNSGRRVDVQFPGHPVQVGQLQVDAAHGQHAGFEQVDIAVIVTGNLREKKGLRMSDCVQLTNVELSEPNERRNLDVLCHPLRRAADTPRSATLRKEASLCRPSSLTSSWPCVSDWRSPWPSGNDHTRTKMSVALHQESRINWQHYTRNAKQQLW